MNMVIIPSTKWSSECGFGAQRRDRLLLMICWLSNNDSAATVSTPTDMMGSTLPMARTCMEHLIQSDPRLSIAKRFTTRAIYHVDSRRKVLRLRGQRNVMGHDMNAVTDALVRRVTTSTH